MIIFPGNFLETAYCILYDTIATDFVVFEHFLFFGFLIAGFNHVQLYTLVLLDWISLSEHMKNVIMSVVKPYYPLLSTLALFFFTIVIFATVGFFEFSPSFILQPEDDNVPTSSDTYCTSPMSCFWQVLYGGVKNGDIGSIMGDIDPSMGETYYYRILFDSVFFIAVIVLLFDMVAGWYHC
jgi:hypothetical protein